MNVLIVGARGAGKTTLIRRVLESLDRPVWGFETEKEGDQVHIYDAGAEHVPTEENLVGLCGETRGIPVKEGFDRYAPRLPGSRKGWKRYDHGRAGISGVLFRAFLQGCPGAPWGEGSGDRSSEGQGYGFFKQRPRPSRLPVFFYHGRKQGCAV